MKYKLGWPVSCRAYEIQYQLRVRLHLAYEPVVINEPHKSLACVRVYLGVDPPIQISLRQSLHGN
jgi:hypothetical protein